MQKAQDDAATEKTDPAAAIGRFAETGEPELRERFGTELATGLARSDPALAADWWSTLPAVDQKEFGSDVSRNITRESPSTAAALSSEYPELFDDQSYSYIADRWMQTDPASASGWIATLPPGSSRDSAVKSLVNKLTQESTRDLAAAVSWAER